MNTNRQKGAALVIALVIVAMATILATTLVWENHLDRRRTAMQLHGSEALANALSVEEFVRAVLVEDERESDHLQEPWAQQGNIFPIEGGSLTGSVMDLQGRFNINNLLAQPAQGQAGIDNSSPLQVYTRLIRQLGLDERIVGETIDWIDADIEPNQGGGAEDDAYLRNNPAYRTANQPLADIGELRLLASMTPEQFAVLEPYVTALPVQEGGEATEVNVNTAPPELLVAYGIPPDEAARLVELRNQAGITSIGDLQSMMSTTVPDGLGVTSNYFRLRVLAVVGSSRVTMYSVLHRYENAVQVLSRSLGTP